MIAITGATGQLGRLVIQHLLADVPASDIVALVRDPQKAGALREAGVQLRVADYDQADTLTAALAGVDRLLLISSSEVGRRAVQHRNVIDAARDAGVGLIAYTSILHADTSPLPLAAEHKQTEAMLATSGVPHVLLRNGWYTENYLASVPAALQHGALFGAAGAGRIASAARDDYALAAATVISGEGHPGKVYELAGDSAYTLDEFAAAIARHAGHPVSYRDLPAAEYEAALLGAGLPPPVATLLAESDAGAARGGLFDAGRELSALIGRPSTSMPVQLERTFAA